MEFSLKLKDIIYIMTFVVTLTGTVYTFRNRINNLEAKVKMLTRVIYKDDSTLRVVTTDDCKAHREESLALTRTALTEIRGVSDNVIRIAAHMDVKLGE